MTEKDLWESIGKRWIEDESFRTEFKNSPREVLKVQYQIDVPEDVNFFIHVPESLKDIHLIMPGVSHIDGDAKDAVNDGRPTIACTSSVRGGTCWLTPVNCPV